MALFGKDTKTFIRHYVERVEVGNETIRIVFKIVVKNESDLVRLNIIRETDRKALAYDGSV